MSSTQGTVIMRTDERPEEKLAHLHTEFFAYCTLQLKLITSCLGLFHFQHKISSNLLQLIHPAVETLKSNKVNK